MASSQAHTLASVQQDRGIPVTSPINHVDCLRFITTYRCNLSCYFCHREGASAVGSLELAPPLFARALHSLVAFGLRKVKLVGGEPALSRFIKDYVSICIAEGVPEIGITTNGLCTKQLGELALAFSTLKFTISVHSIDQNEYGFLTGGGRVARPLRTLRTLYDMGVATTVNMVVDRCSRIRPSLMREVEQLSHFAVRLKLVVPCETRAFGMQVNQRAILDNLLDLIAAEGIQYGRRKLNHIIFPYKNGKEVLVTMPYCPYYCRELQLSAPTLRLTPEGFLKPCLLFDQDDLLLPLKTGTTGELHGVISECLSSIRFCHLAGGENNVQERRSF